MRLTVAGLAHADHGQVALPHVGERHLHLSEGGADGHPREVVLLGALLLQAALRDLVRVRVGVEVRVGVRVRARVRVGFRAAS